MKSRLAWLLPAAAFVLGACVGTIGDGDGNKQGTTDPPGVDPGSLEVSVGHAVGRRLTSEEVFNSVHVALGVDLDPAAFNLPRDERVPGGFRNSAGDQLLSQNRVSGYHEIAAAAVAAADWNALLTEHASCTDLTTACYEGFIASMGRTVMRRPVPDAEIGFFVPLFDVAIAEGDGFVEGAQLATRALLESSRFLYRLEVQSGEDTAGEGESREIDDYELATRLSFLVWNAGPDRELLDLAEEGELAGRIDEQVERLLGHAFARRAMRQYIEQWLYLDATPTSFTLAPALKEQTYRLFEWLAWDQQANLMDAFTSQRAELTGELADFYGVVSQGADWAVYDMSPLPERVGFLTHASVMAARTVNPDSSMIDRGLFVLNDVFCDSVPPPEDPGLQEEIENVKVPEGSGLSQRERFAIQSENPLCAGCHGKFDNLGLAFENFGSAGQYLTEDQWGNALTGHGEITLKDVDVAYANVGEFVVALSQSEAVARCLVEKSMQHAYGRKLATKDVDKIDVAYSEFAASGGTYHALIRAVAQANDFTLVQVAP